MAVQTRHKIPAFREHVTIQTLEKMTWAPPPPLPALAEGLIIFLTPTIEYFFLIFFLFFLDTKAGPLRTSLCFVLE